MANIDNESTKTNLFEPPVVAQYIRVIPVVCRKACTLRMELVGCELNGEGEAGGIPNGLIQWAVKSQPVAPFNGIVQRIVYCNSLPLCSCC